MILNMDAWFTVPLELVYTGVCWSNLCGKVATWWLLHLLVQHFHCRRSYEENREGPHPGQAHAYYHFLIWERMFLDSGNIISDETFCAQSQIMVEKFLNLQQNLSVFVRGWQLVAVVVTWPFWIMWCLCLCHSIKNSNFHFLSRWRCESEPGWLKMY